jgi:hypothetical protein
MIGLVQLIVFGFLGLTVIYVIVTTYARSTERERLERSFDADHPDLGQDQARATAREGFITAGMIRYRSSLRRKLLWLVYILPMAAILLTIYVVNSQ